MHFEGRKAALQSVVGLLGLGAGEHATIELVATGRDAAKALERVAHELLREAHGEAEETPARIVSPAPAAAGIARAARAEHARGRVRGARHRGRHARALG